MATRVSQFRTVSPALVEHRAVARLPIMMTRAKVSKRGSRPVQAMLRDLSVYGCRLACSVAHAEGDRIWLRLGEGDPIAARVMWNDGQNIGCRFDTPIERSLMRSLTLVIC